MQARRLYEIDLLRFTAALAVMMYHYMFRGAAADQLSPISLPAWTPFVRYGYLGVDLFFIISGFVILMTTRQRSSRRFVVSRVVRLYPAFWFCCALTFALVRWAGGADSAISWPDFMINLTMFGNYFKAPPVDAAYWSLFVEMKFYILVLLVLLLRQMHRIEWLLLGWLALTIGQTVHLVPFVSDWLIPRYAPYFITGAYCYLIYSEGLTWRKAIPILLCYGLSLIHAWRDMAHLQAYFRTPFSPVAITVILAIFFVLFFLIAINRTHHLATPKWQVLGVLTYPLYLLHQNIGYLIFNRWHEHMSPAALIGGTMAAMLLAAWLVYRFVEKPFAPRLQAFLETVLRLPAAGKRPPAVLAAGGPAPEQKS